MPENYKREGSFVFFNNDGEWLPLGTVDSIGKDMLDACEVKQSPIHWNDISNKCSVTLSCKPPRLVVRRNRKNAIVNMDVFAMVVGGRKEYARRMMESTK